MKEKKVTKKNVKQNILNYLSKLSTYKENDIELIKIIFNKKTR